MPTVVLDAISKAYSSITNRIRAAVFNENDLLAPIATIIDATAGHPQRVWHFPGLPRANYAFSLDEINGSDIPIRNLAFFDVVPSAIDGLLTRKDEQIQVGHTAGFDAGLSTIIFDGGETSPGSGLFRPNYIGWDIVPSELAGGRGLMVEGLDYSWNEASGEFKLLQGGDILIADTYYNIHFNPGLVVAGGSVPTIKDFSSRLITATGNINVTDFGNNIVLEPGGEYIELTLPSILTVPIGRPLSIDSTEVKGIAGLTCTKILPNGADVIKFEGGLLYINSGESLTMYRFRRPDLSNEWRILQPFGNFHRVGESCGDDAIQTGVYLKKLKDGSSESKFKYARIYNTYLLLLPAAQLVDYDSWATGNNKYLFSKANSADPGNLNKFHFPDHRGQFERNNNAGKAGDFLTESIKILADVLGVKTNTTSGGGNTTIGPAASPLDASPAEINVLTGFPIVTPGATETRPAHILINKYLFV